ncbi:hydroxyacid dehydrogenase [Dactylosporangium fulvum]|uniref:Hydroxyacid dehydrogenase n=2 Tax=Dactylosporangium fulvum TaxID=53359 RepID=A0ABY5VQH9_9ACTN|nr:hydroxyacid dehydrogenase [Dactylosporangium fulvum]UWP80028.1 hydroxyacid dehydrogenase [Dactylosporangium fulvum]
MARLAGVLRLVGTEAVETFDDPVVRRGMETVEVLITGWSCPPLTAEVLDATPRLRAVMHAAGSVKAHVCPEVFARGVVVSSAADANAEPVVDFTLAVITLAGKRAFGLARQYAAGRYAPFAQRIGNDGRVVGVVGASRIGRRVIARLRAAGYQVLVADPYLDRARAAELGAELTDLNELCRRSDVVTLHAPQLPETHHLIDERRLALLRDGALVVNTARGSVVDTDALTRACASGRIDACLDVTDPEPLPAGHPLFGMPNVWITPHLAGVQGTEVRRLGEFAVAEVERFVAGEPLRGAVRADQLGQLA